MSQTRCFTLPVGGLAAAGLLAWSCFGHGAPSEVPINISNRLKLSVDRTLMDGMENVQLRLRFHLSDADLFSVPSSE